VSEVREGDDAGSGAEEMSDFDEKKARLLAECDRLRAEVDIMTGPRIKPGRESKVTFGNVEVTEGELREALAHIRRRSWRSKLWAILVAPFR
jgi:hypothetical protein